MPRRACVGGPVTLRGALIWEIGHAKADHDYSVAGRDRHFGGDWADGWFVKSDRNISIDEPNKYCRQRHRSATANCGATGAHAEGIDELPERSNRLRERGA